MAGQAEASSSTGSLIYDVFLNFRGEDTRKGFTGHLYRALNREKINVFMDSHNLWEGEEIGPTLFKAIQGSKISIPVFSKSYANSQWCLIELAQMLECHLSNHQIVLPIFFDVDPSDVRHQTKSFEEAFLEHERRFELHVVDHWREALRKVGNVKGWVLNQIENGDESRLIELVVERVFKEITSNICLSDIKYPIGLYSRLNDVLSLFNIGSKDVRFIGICGKCGIGKTTIAMALYNYLFKSFRQNSFLANIGEEATGSMGLVSLQEKLIHGISKRKVDVGIFNFYKGKILIKENFQGEKVLLVLDDVNDLSQLDALAIDQNWFGPGSIVIIMTRDEHILKVANVDTNKIYWPKELDATQSLELFSLHAFQKNQPFEEYMKLSNDVACYTRGLPLALKVLGSYFSDLKSKEEWESIIHELRKSSHKKIHEKLKISYDNLENDHQKAIFLDAACFFVGWKKKTIISIWDACEYYPKAAIKKLMQRSLLKFTEEDRLEMHDLIRDMGRKIVSEENHMEPGKRSRLWYHDEILKVFEGNKGTEKIIGIQLVFDWPNQDVYLSSECFDTMSNLKYLQIDEAFAYLPIDEAGSKRDFPHLPYDLRCLRWKRCPLEVLPVDFYHKRLVHLDLSMSKIQLAWNIRPQSEYYKFQNLRALNLRRCENLSNCPDFSWFPKLEQLDLRGCPLLGVLDESIGKLNHLKSLNLSHCISLNKLPESIGNLEFLLELSLGSTKIEELPHSICKLSSLQVVNLSECESLSRLPESIGDLESLLVLSLERTKIEKLPHSICKLGSLSMLNLRECESLSRLPESIGDLGSLLELSLWRTKIEELPHSICKLSSLQMLYLGCCQSLNKLPESIGELKSLLELYLDETMIKELPNSICWLTNLKMLNLDCCESLCKLPKSIGDLKSLVELHLNYTGINELPDSVGLLEKLEVLNVQDCQKLVNLPRSIGRMSCLRSINLRGTSISKLPTDFPMLLSLVELDITCKTNVEEQFNSCLCPIRFGGLSQLQKLSLFMCTWLESLPELPPSLTRLSCIDCKSLERLPDLSNLKSLRDLYIKGCYKLETIRGLEGIESLERLTVHDCSKVTDTPRKQCFQVRPLDDVPGSDLPLLYPPRCHCLGALRRLTNQRPKGGIDPRNQSHSGKRSEYPPLCLQSKRVRGYSFLNANYGIRKRLFLVVAFAFHPLLKEMRQEGELVDVRLHICTDICWKDRKIRCNHNILIENVEFTTERDIIYIHELEGFTWFGFPLEGKDLMMSFIKGLMFWDSCSYSHRLKCIKFWSLEYENEECGQANFPNQEWGERIVKDTLSGIWPDVDVVAARSHTVFDSGHSALTEEPEEDKRSSDKIDSHSVPEEEKLTSACGDGGGISHSIPQEEEKSDYMTDSWPLLLF